MQQLTKKYEYLCNNKHKTSNIKHRKGNIKVERKYQGKKNLWY